MHYRLSMHTKYWETSKTVPCVRHRDAKCPSGDSESQWLSSCCSPSLCGGTIVHKIQGSHLHSSLWEKEKGKGEGVPLAFNSLSGSCTITSVRTYWRQHSHLGSPIWLQGSEIFILTLRLSMCWLKTREGSATKEGARVDTGAWLAVCHPTSHGNQGNWMRS